MTNEEKSIELSKKHEDLRGIRNFEECIVAACQDMAEWKEKQMIGKACEWLKEHVRDYFFAEYCGEELTGEVSINDNFIEDFRKAMEEQL